MSVFFIHLCIYAPHKGSSNPHERNPVSPVPTAPWTSASSQQALHRGAEGSVPGFGAPSVRVQEPQQTASAHTTHVGRPLFLEHLFATNVGESFRKVSSEFLAFNSLVVKPAVSLLTDGQGRLPPAELCLLCASRFSFLVACGSHSRRTRRKSHAGNRRDHRWLARGSGCLRGTIRSPKHSVRSAGR